jgi:subfamily B ATP-binding cassette protein HlyB/CyaB
MFSGHVAAPIIRLSQLWQELQQVGLSMRRLGDILNTRSETPPSAQSQSAIAGRIVFSGVSFRYQVDGPEVLHNLSLDIPCGEVLGIVGRSGCGKSTLSKLVQRLYLPERGQVSIDGIDLILADPAWLRRQVGVVLQENRLFNRSIRDNIALADPGMPLAAVIEAAKLAGAHEFICALPQAYDTLVGEQGGGLSGGQRQRIAIARALITNPRILIFDEATSALDYESEQVIGRNMRAICAGRTVLIIAHRLSAVRHAERIIAMEHGRIVEAGSHDQLLANADGYYARLVAMQHG